MRARLSFLAVVAASAAVGCEEDLADAIERVRAAAPDVCKDFCEDEITCEWAAAGGDREGDAFEAAIRHCVIDCAWYAANGAYVVTQGAGLKEYVDRVGGPALEEALGCAFYAGAFRCAQIDGGDAHLFSAPVESICESSAKCMETLGVDYGIGWSAQTSTCEAAGTEMVETSFF